MPIARFPGTAIQSDSIPASQFAFTADAPPRIANVEVTNSSYSFIGGNLSVSTGGYVLITGSGFVSGCSVVVGGFITGNAATLASAVSFVNTTVVQAQLPAQAAGQQSIYVVNPSGTTALRVAAVSYS